MFIVSYHIFALPDDLSFPYLKKIISFLYRELPFAIVKATTNSLSFSSSVKIHLFPLHS